LARGPARPCYLESSGLIFRLVSVSTLGECFAVLCKKGEEIFAMRAGK
jgi:hypothetical protein